MIGLACTLLLASGCIDAPAAAAPPIEYVGSAQGLRPQAALAEINAFRRRHGLKPVVLDQRLVWAAGTSAWYQASRGRIGHRGPGGSRAWDRARSAGYSPHLAAENVASVRDPSARRCAVGSEAPATGAICCCPMPRPPVWR